MKLLLSQYCTFRLLFVALVRHGKVIHTMSFWGRFFHSEMFRMNTSLFVGRYMHQTLACPKRGHLDIDHRFCPRIPRLSSFRLFIHNVFHLTFSTISENNEREVSSGIPYLMDNSIVFKEKASEYRISYAISLPRRRGYKLHAY